MLTYTIAKDVDKSVPPKLAFLIENRALLEERQFLLRLFTQTDHLIYQLPDNVNGQELIRLTATMGFDLLPLVDQPIIAVPKAAATPINFPEEEISTLRKQQEIVTTRIQEERDKYRMGQRVLTPWGETYVVSRLKKCRHLGEHPFQDKLTPAQKTEIGEQRFTVYTLTQVRFGDTCLAGEDYAIYGVLSQSILREQLPMSDLQGRSPAQLLLVKLSDNGTVPPFRLLDQFNLIEGMIENYQEECTTTVGRYLMNYLILVKPFGKLFPYLNQTWKLSDIDRMVAKAILKKTIGRTEYDKYMTYGFFIGQFTQLGVPCLSKKSLTTDPKAKALRQKLMTENKGKLDDPLVMTKIEDELVAMDKAWLKGDSAAVFYAVTAKKSYNEHRKKLYLTMGTFAAFDKRAGDYTFISRSLAEGWDPKDLPTLANESRRGTAGRALGTAKGGEETKFIIRIFQDKQITEDDCKSVRGMELVLTESTYKHYLDRYCWYQGKLVQLTESTIKSYIGKPIQLRSPKYCKTKGGLCYVCAGGYFQQLGNPNIGMMTLDIGSTFTSLEMASMHVSGVSTTTIPSLNPFFISK